MGFCVSGPLLPKEVSSPASWEALGLALSPHSGRCSRVPPTLQMEPPSFGEVQDLSTFNRDSELDLLLGGLWAGACGPEEAKSPWGWPETFTVGAVSPRTPDRKGVRKAGPELEPDQLLPLATEGHLLLQRVEPKASPLGQL